MKRRLNISGSPVLGVFAACTDELAFVPPDVPDETAGYLEESLGVPVYKVFVGGSSIIGSFLCGNSRGIIAAGLIYEKEIRSIRKHIKAARLTQGLNAAGNLIMCNDTAALVHPELTDKSLNVIEKYLGVNVKRGTIGGLGTIGMAGVATNKGVLVHPKATQHEIGVIKDLFGLPVDIGTVNFGSPLVGSGLLANSTGYVAGLETTGHELARIGDALGFL
jgi:translation initiation factor 6